MLPSVLHQKLHLTPHGTETILLVDDEEAVRTYTVFALKKFGYTVLQATHGREAIQLCEKHNEPIHLLVSDVVMPEMGGGKVAEVLIEMRPEIKVLFLSAYSQDAMLHDGVVQEHFAFLQKPYSLNTLACKVRDVLDG